MADKTVKKLNGENALDDLDKPSVTLVMYKKSELNLWPTFQGVEPKEQEEVAASSSL